jgi:hypothetical protein
VNDLEFDASSKGRNAAVNSRDATPPRFTARSVVRTVWDGILAVRGIWVDWGWFVAYIGDAGEHSAW